MAGPPRYCLLALKLFIGLSLAMPAIGLPRVASINLCTDQLLYFLADPEQIVSYSHLATDANLSYIQPHVGNTPINHGLVEELIPLRPDLIIGSLYAAREAVHLLKLQGFRVELFGLTENLDSIYDSIRRAGQLLEQPTRAESLVASMKARLSALPSRNKSRSALIYAPNGFTSGAHTLSDELLHLAGLDNFAARSGLEGYGFIDLEQVAAGQPDLLIINDGTANQYSLSQRYLQHPALKPWRQHQRIINMPSQLWICGGPMAVDAVTYLREASTR